MLPSEEAIFTKIALQNQFVSKEQIEECQRIQNSRDRHVPLGMLLIEKGYINDRKLNLITEIRLSQKLSESSEDFVVLTCENCQHADTITHFELDEIYYCKRCGSALNSGDEEDEVDLEEYVELGEVSPSFVGEVVYGYKVLEHIGEGGMANVFKAIHIQTNKIVAIKLLKSLASPERFIREIQHLSVIDHPNVIRVMYRGKYQDRYFYIMEHLDGENLLERINKENFPLKTTLSILKQIAYGLQAVHEKGIWHRDIKPSNIMICETEKDEDLLVKIMDFGVARGVGDSDFTAPGQLVGTFKYMSPEQIRGQELDARSDIFSLGILAYELLARQEPFYVKESLGYLHANIVLEPPPLQTINSELSTKLCEVVHKMLSKEKANRYFTSELIRDLERVNQSLEQEEELVEKEDIASVFYVSPHSAEESSEELEEQPVLNNTIDETQHAISIEEQIANELNAEFLGEEKEEILESEPSENLEEFETQEAIQLEGTVITAPVTEEINPAISEADTDKISTREDLDRTQDALEQEPTEVVKHILLPPDPLPEKVPPKLTEQEKFQKELRRQYQELKRAKTDEEFRIRITRIENLRKEERAKESLIEIDNELMKAHLRWGGIHQEQAALEEAKKIYLRGLCLYNSDYSNQMLNHLRKIDRSVKEMAYIPPGSYPIDEEEREFKTLGGFFMDKTEVTNQKYRQFLRVTGRKAPLHWNNDDLYPPGTELHPVVFVSFEDATHFAHWQEKKLPTEEEWEYSARGTSYQKWSFGSRFDSQLCNTREAGIGGTSKVDRYPEGESPFRLMDMIGNVWEWTRTPYEYDEFKVKGGSYLTFDEFCMIDQFNYFPKTKQAAHLGFRCCKAYSVKEATFF